jgi:hypothetical protein
MIKALIEKLKKEPVNNISNNKEIMKIQIRLITIITSMIGGNYPEMQN